MSTFYKEYGYNLILPFDGNWGIFDKTDGEQVILYALKHIPCITEKTFFGYSLIVGTTDILGYLHRVTEPERFCYLCKTRCPEPILRLAADMIELLVQ